MLSVQRCWLPVTFLDIHLSPCTCCGYRRKDALLNVLFNALASARFDESLLCLLSFLLCLTPAQTNLASTVYATRRRCMDWHLAGFAGHESRSFHDRHAAQQGCHDDPNLAAVHPGVL